MKTTPGSPPRRRGRRDDRPKVVKTAFFAATGFSGTAVTMLTIASGSPSLDGTTRLALVVVAAVFGLAMFLAAIYVWQRR